MPPLLRFPDVVVIELVAHWSPLSDLFSFSSPSFIVAQAFTAQPLHFTCAANIGYAVPPRHDGSATGHLSSCPPIRHGVHSLSLTVVALWHLIGSRLDYRWPQQCRPRPLLSLPPPPSEPRSSFHYRRRHRRERGSSPFIAARSARTKRSNFKLRFHRVLEKHSMDFIVRFYDFAHKLPGSKIE